MIKSGLKRENVWKLKNFSGGTIGVPRLDFTGKTGGGGVSNALIVRLSAVGLLARCLLLLLVLYLHLLYSVMWWLHTQALRLFICIVSIYTYNVYYVIKGIKLFYDTYIIDFILSTLTGILSNQTSKPYVVRILAVEVLIF